MGWNDVSKMLYSHDELSLLSRQTTLEQIQNDKFKIFKMSIAVRRAAETLFLYDEAVKNGIGSARLDEVGEFLLHYSYKSNIAREVLKHCSAQSIKDSKNHLLLYFLNNYDWIRPSFAIDAYDRLYFDALTASTTYDKEAKKANPDMLEKFYDSHRKLEWRERPEGVSVDYEKQANGEYTLKICLSDEADVSKLSEYLKNNIDFLRNADTTNNKLREQLIFNTAVTWLCTTTDYNNKTIFRIVFTIFSKDDKLKIFLPTKIKENEELASAKIRGIRSTMNADIKKDWFNLARKELESDRKTNPELYNTHYNSNPAGFFFERFNLSFDEKTKKFHLSVMD